MDKELIRQALLKADEMIRSQLDDLGEYMEADGDDEGQFAIVLYEAEDVLNKIAKALHELKD